MKNKETWQRIGIIALTILLSIAMIWINTYQRSAKYYKEGMELLSNDNLLDAVTSFETAAHAYTPFNFYVKNSLEKLWEIGERLEKEKNSPEYPLIAYRCLRSSIFAIRSFYAPYKEWIPKCDEKIQLLVEIQKQQIRQDEASEPQPEN